MQKRSRLFQILFSSSKFKLGESEKRQIWRGASTRLDYASEQCRRKYCPRYNIATLLCDEFLNAKKVAASKLQQLSVKNCNHVWTDARDYIWNKCMSFHTLANKRMCGRPVNPFPQRVDHLAVGFIPGARYFVLYSSFIRRLVED